MKKFVRIHKHSIEQHLILVLLVCSIYVFFHGKITSFLIESTFVESFLVIKTNNIYTVLTFFGIIASVSRLYCKYDFKFSSKLIFFPITFTLVYLYERFFGDYKIDFASIYCLDSIKYFDIIALFVDILFILTIIKKPKELKKLEREYGFFEDLELPVSSNDDEDLELSVSSNDDEDLLKYGNYARRVAQNIEKSSFNRAFAIGVTGIWGAGKTSFMNLILNSFSAKKVIVIRFNPWSTNNINQLIPNFFETITEGLINEGIIIKNDISKYLQKISQVELGVLGESFKPIINGFSDEVSIEDLKRQISAKIIAEGKKIIITIDDLDRLNKQEINEVLRLIRNTANFSNVCYLVAYDKEYVISFLKDEYQFDFKNYLEKIFQLEINLPAFKKRILIDKLKQNLEKILDEINDEKLKEKYKNEVISLAEYNPCFESIENLRDVTRLSNSMLTNFIPLAGEVDIFDFINLEILRMKHWEVYELLKKDKYAILQHSDIESHYSIKESRLIVKEDFEDINKDGKIVNSKNAVKILNAIFYKELNFFNQNDDTNKLSLYKISTPSRFIFYFAYGVIDDELSLKILVESLNDELSFKSQIEHCVHANNYSSLYDYFENNDSFDSIEAYKNFIKGLFYFFSQLKIKRNLSTVDVNIIDKKFRDRPTFFPDNQFIDFYSELFDVKQFDNEAFVKLDYFKQTLKYRHFQYLPLPKSNVKACFDSLVQSFLINSFSVSDKFYYDFIDIKNCIIDSGINSDAHFYKDLLKKEIRKRLESTLKDSLIEFDNEIEQNQRKWSVHILIREIFDGLANFKIFLQNDIENEKLKNEAFFTEYIRFLSEIITLESNSKDNIFKFTDIDLNLFDK